MYGIDSIIGRSAIYFWLEQGYCPSIPIIDDENYGLPI
jgi:hypothetical protein